LRSGSGNPLCQGRGTGILAAFFFDRAAVGAKVLQAPMFSFSIEFGDGTTRVVVDTGLLDRVGQLILAAGLPNLKKVCLITDRTVGALYGDQVAASLRAAGLDCKVQTIEPGESSKSLDGAGRLYDGLARQQLGRDGLILALGGGVVSDLAGFVAATWLRGLPFAICPTTLEADVDASIGGKTAVNIDAGKNLVGVFHQPVLVAADPLCLKTLDRRDVRSGLSESIKHALLFSEEFLAWHEERAEAILALDPDTMADLIGRNMRLKADVVREDARERTERRVLLNFGHTLGHAIERCCEYRHRHGECVALGMLAACRLSHSLGLLSTVDVDRVEAVLRRFRLPTVLEDPPEWSNVLARMRVDKKVRQDKVRFVLIDAVAQPVVRDDVPELAVKGAYESLLPS
jgi:3-dehydroquinate synthase